MIATAVCLAIRLLPPPFRAPNVEPIMATMMPFAKAKGALAGALFAFISMVLLDLVQGRVGMWTLVTAVTYGVLGACAPLYFARLSGVRGYVSYAVLATLVFDGVTGVLMGPLLFGQTFTSAFVGQIPFTVLHLLGNMALALTISSVIEVWLVHGFATSRIKLATSAA